MTTADIILRRASDILGSKRDENCSPGSVDSVNSEIARVKDGKELLALFERYVDSRGCKQVFSVTQMVKIGSVNSIFMRKCLSDDKFWDRNLVEKLILSKTVSVMEHRDLIQKIIQHNDITLLYSCLSEVVDIDEEDLVRTVSFALSDPDRLKALDYDAQLEKDTLFEFAPMDKLLLSCINARVSSSVLHVALAGLESDSVALFLNYLSALLKIYRGSEKVKDSLNLDAILDWLLATLDGNLGQILLSDSCQESIRILHETLSSMYALFIHVKSLRGLLNQFEFILRKPSGNLADATPSKKRCFYQIEQLHI